ncbi:hypothetical protein [Neorhodopirellula pilleata]|uniref:PEP-CTERM protein-sorting domain-containing protein n=1 Tax=Neorhodopirellula pilleata TaxID=2714738 RepID=A0A5C6AAI9_9BACT|nr:hypothetical protein [Neorhodopirellula pilleata]TWT96328.1 hypothetical protein Pla100_28050 [Neorhodopirellula pilleata]
MNDFAPVGWVKALRRTPGMLFQSARTRWNCRVSAEAAATQPTLAAWVVSFAAILMAWMLAGSPVGWVKALRRTPGRLFQSARTRWNCRVSAEAAATQPTLGACVVSFATTLMVWMLACSPVGWVKALRRTPGRLFQSSRTRWNCRVSAEAAATQPTLGACVVSFAAVLMAWMLACSPVGWVKALRRTPGMLFQSARSHWNCRVSAEAAATQPTLAACVVSFAAILMVWMPAGSPVGWVKALRRTPGKLFQSARSRWNCRVSAEAAATQPTLAACVVSFATILMAWMLAGSPVGWVKALRRTPGRPFQSSRSRSNCRVSAEAAATQPTLAAGVVSFGAILMAWMLAGSPVGWVKALRRTPGRLFQSARSRWNCRVSAEAAATQPTLGACVVSFAAILMAWMLACSPVGWVKALRRTPGRLFQSARSRWNCRVSAEAAATQPTLAACVVSFATILMAWMPAGSADAAFVIQFDPSQTTVQSNGSDQVFTIDVLVTHDGLAGPSVFSGFTFRLNDPGTDLSYSNAGEADFAFTQAPIIDLSHNTNLYSLGAASNNTEYTVISGQTKRLMSVDFLLKGSVDSGTFALDLTLVDAKRGTANTGGMVDISSFTTVMDGLFTVNNAIAVPEPGTLGVLVIFGVAMMGSRRKRLVNYSAPKPDA